MDEPNWTDILTAVSSAAVPVVVVFLGIVLSRRQSRNAELLRVRLNYYQRLAPDLNRLLCYLTFIGTWRDESPAAIVALKRSLDSTFFVAAPLFSPAAEKAYKSFIDSAFRTFGEWGQDALINSSAYRRRQFWKGVGGWAAEWDSMFALADEEDISKASLERFQSLYDSLLSALVADTNIARTRPRYTTNRVSQNASADRLKDVKGKG